MTFFFEKSLPCRYSALSLHLEMVERWPLSGSPFQSAFALGSLCLRSGSTPKIGGMVNPKRDEKDLTTLYKVRAERACSLCRAKQRHEVTTHINLSDETKINDLSP